MKQLILATHNDHKAQEFRDILQQYSLQTLKELGYDAEVEETGKNLEENSFHKAKTVFKVYGHVVISDDSGLEVNALNGAPGVFCTLCRRTQGRLSKYKKTTRRTTRYIKPEGTIQNGDYLMNAENSFQFEGVVSGTITEIPRGVKGFGYDPIFYLRDISKLLRS